MQSFIEAWTYSWGAIFEILGYILPFVIVGGAIFAIMFIGYVIINC